MVSPTRLSSKLVFHSFDSKTSEGGSHFDWDFAWKREPDHKRVCLRFSRVTGEISVGLRQHDHVDGKGHGGWDFLFEVSHRYAPAVAALMPPEELARLTRVRLGVRHGQP